MTKLHFTQKSLAALPRPTGTNYVIYRDLKTQGLGLKVEASGHRTFVWTRKGHGQRLWRTIGECSATDLETARGAANGFNKALADWKRDGHISEDPFARPAALTLGEVVQMYADRHVRHSAAKPERAAKGVEWQVEKYLSKLKDRKVVTLRRNEILKLRESVHAAAGPYAANRLVQMLRAALNWSITEAELWKGPNPVSGIALYEETERDRFLGADEMQKLRDALAAPETDADLRDFVRLSLMCGMRKSDLLSLRWEAVDLPRATALVVRPKNRKPYFALLPQAAVEILQERLERAKALQEKTGTACAWVFPGTSKKVGHILDLKRSWKSLLERAGLADLRQHDLRRTFASWQAAGGASMLVISKGLGQRNTGATPIYARLSDEPVRLSIESATRAMFAEAPAAAPAPAPAQLPAAVPAPARRRRA